MRTKNDNTEQHGFTIIELLIATTIFSVILLMASAGIVQIGRLYYKGLTQSRTQETARAVVEEVNRSVQFAKGDKIVVSEAADKSSGTFCIGDTRYVYVVNQKVGGTSNALTAQRLNGAACSVPPPSQPVRELLGNNMRLLAFLVEQEPYDSKSYRVEVRIAYGDNDLLSHYANNATETDTPISPARDAVCKSGIAGSNFCATARLDTLVKKRLN
jgi:prepilin-type N-terminal cleavage/methylation domain-containing protein